nr:hypothetical protein [uncultured Cupriavidus sp.]
MSYDDSQEKYFEATLTELSKQAATLVIQGWGREAAAVKVVTRFVNSSEAAGDVQGVLQTLEENQPITVAGKASQVAQIANEIRHIVEHELSKVLSAD